MGAAHLTLQCAGWVAAFREASSTCPYEVVVQKSMFEQCMKTIFDCFLFCFSPQKQNASEKTRGRHTSPPALGRKTARVRHARVDCDCATRTSIPKRSNQLSLNSLDKFFVFVSHCCDRFRRGVKSFRGPDCSTEIYLPAMNRQTLLLLLCLAPRPAISVF